ncbi:MAG: DUF2029 domain-containing protein [Chloroflexota bacterium]|nr:DUF2029 domain-containing protein [Chloroflexota bacterium]
MAIISVTAMAYSVLQTDAMLRGLGFEPWGDWRTYANAVDRFFSGGALYAPAQLSGPYLMPRATIEVGYTYPPPSVLLLAPFAAGVPGLVAWLVVNAGILLTGVTAIIHRGFRTSLPLALAISAFSLALYPPFTDGMAVGNINVGIAGLLAWCWVRRDGGRWIGAAAGISAVLKVYPGVLTAWDSRRRGWTAVRDAVFAGAFISLLTLPLVGIGLWIDFVHVLANAQPACWPTTTSLTCALLPITGVTVARVIALLVAVAAIGGALRVRSPFIAFALVTVAMLAPVADGWLHYWLFPYVVVVAGLAYLLGGRRESTKSISVSTPSAGLDRPSTEDRGAPHAVRS